MVSRQQDLVARKLARDGGASADGTVARRMLTRDHRDALCESGAAASCRNLRCPRTNRVAELEATQLRGECSNNCAGENRAAALARAFDYMMQMGYVSGAWQMARAALLASGRAGESDDPFYSNKLRSVAFYCENLLPRARAHAAVVRGGSQALLGFESEWL